MPLLEPLSPRSQALYQGIQDKSRTHLSRAITLVESTREADIQDASALLSHVLNKAKGHQGFRIGFSGSPGVGKSTFIEAFGRALLEKGHRPAILAVDPSSERTGGSILGDKTRMPHLSRDPRAYIRPSPSRGTLGGVARRTSEALLLCEATGHDVCIVETVGVGQSETLVADMVDMFILLVSPAGGDELQGLKRGIVELADLIIVNKSDGDLLPAARRASMEYTSALKFSRPRFTCWKPKVLMVSAATGTGIPEFFTLLDDYYTAMKESGELEELKRRQRTRWMWREVTDTLLYQVTRDARTRNLAVQLEPAVAEGHVLPSVAASRLLTAYLGASQVVKEKE
ncbi:MAG: arginine/ornithine transport system ATPase [Piptocephalis tieghemiana]|nr:MAG: arginine/ornithine transport system ATPase [Piptocephalis tieghemiana]